MIYSFDPIYNKDSRVLILGSMASVKSLEKGFYYMHPRNRFWATISKVVGLPVPDDIEGKKKWLLANNIALISRLSSCHRKCALDSDIPDVTPKDIMKVLETADIQAIYCNGRKSYDTAVKTYPNLTFHYLPSTSPANAGKWSEDAWLKVGETIRQ